MQSLSKSKSCASISSQSQTDDDAKADFGDLGSIEISLAQLEQTFEKSGPSGEQNIRSLIYEKFRSQIAFESGQHFINLLKQETHI